MDTVKSVAVLLLLVGHPMVLRFWKCIMSKASQMAAKTLWKTLWHFAQIAIVSNTMDSSKTSIHDTRIVPV